jgi:hypothetical protein
MLGLVVLLNKKNAYLYDDLKNLNNQLRTSYVDLFRHEDISKKKTRTPKKLARPADHHVISIKENLPIIMDVSSIESIIEYENQRMDEILKQARQAQHLTIDEFADDFTSSLIPCEYDYLRDSFDVVYQESGEYQHLPGTSITQLFTDENYLEQTVYTKKTSTEEKRKPFRQFDFNQKVEMPKLSESTINDEEKELEMRKEQRIEKSDLQKFGESEIGLPLDSGFGGIPELYQDTIIEYDKSAAFMAQVEAREMMPPPPIPTLHSPEEVVVSKRGLPRTISVELQELQAKKAKKIEQAQRIAERKHRFIFDQNTQLTVQEMERRIKSSATGMVGPQVVGTFDEDHSEQEDVTILTEDMEERRRNLDSLFRSKSGWVHTKYDYLKIDLFNQPSCQLMRQTDRIFNRSELNMFVKNKYLQMNMKSKKVPDDRYFYLSGQPANEIEESFERERKATSRLEEPSIIRSKRESIQAKRVSEQFKEISREEHLTPAAANAPAPDLFRAAEEPTFYEQPQPLGESYAQPLPVREETMPDIIKPFEPDYGYMIFDKLKKANGKKLILQDIIKSEPLPDRLLESKKPRRLLAAKLFSATLKLCADQKISVTQKKTYGDIQMSLND